MLIHTKTAARSSGWVVAAASIVLALVAVGVGVAVGVEGALVIGCS
jgi:hypothetical protein